MSKFTDRIDMSFKYTPAATTNIRETIKREQKRIDAEKAAADEAQKQLDAETATVVQPMIKRSRA